MRRSRSSGRNRDQDPAAGAGIRELRRRPAYLVTYAYYSSDGDDERRDIAVRELAEEQLKDMDSSPNCDRDLERRLRNAM